MGRYSNIVTPSGSGYKRKCIKIKKFFSCTTHNTTDSTMAGQENSSAYVLMFSRGSVAE
jgi:hypothetical protein